MATCNHSHSGTNDVSLSFDACFFHYGYQVCVGCKVLMSKSHQGRGHLVIHRREHLEFSAKELKVSGALAAECSLRLWSTAGYLCHVMCISSLFPFHPTPSTVYTFNIFHHLRTALATFSLEHSILGNYCFSNPCCTPYTSGVFRPGKDLLHPRDHCGRPKTFSRVYG